MQGALRYVIFAYLAAGLILWATLSKLFAALAYAASVPDPALIGSGFTLANLLGLMVAAGAGFYAFKNEQARDFSLDVVSELRKVTWPSRKETQTATVVVIITTVVVALILGFFDLVWGQVTGFIYRR